LKLAHYVKNGSIVVGIVHKDRMFGLDQTLLEGTNSIDRILSEGILGSLQRTESKIVTATGGIAVESAQLRSPILSPEKILLVARNYLSHNKEQNAKPPNEPYFFIRTRNSLLGPDEPILLPRISKKADWEGELAVIIGKAGKNIARKNAMDYVAGFTVSNDISFRDLQFSTRPDNAAVALGSNWVKGKNLDSSFPLGPWLVTKDEIPDPHNLEISLTVNGETKQHASTSDMIFKIDHLIEYVSAGMTLRPGDIISTGTPEGVAAFTVEQFLKDGDVIEVTIEGIGTLRNPVRTEE
jgi:2-keto-4-pentenoate hydratase/2-oxohepta-3-ene-1,7-dioic acid hydratase in catechol pathway